MEKVIKEYMVYEYKELSFEAKEVVKKWLLDDTLRVDFFKEDCQYILNDAYSNSDLSIQFSLSGCQGDGLNVYGSVDEIDLIKHGDLTENEIILLTDNNIRLDDLVLEYNNRYCYSLIGNRTLEDYLDLVENSNFYDDEIGTQLHKDIMVIATKIYNKNISILSKMANVFETSGYDYLYNMDEGEAEEYCNMNDYKFLESGELFV